MPSKTVTINVPPYWKIKFDNSTTVGNIKYEIHLMTDGDLAWEAIELFLHGGRPLNNEELWIQDLGLERKDKLDVMLNSYVPPEPQPFNLKLHFYDLPLPMTDFEVFGAWTFKKVKNDIAREFGLLSQYIRLFTTVNNLMANYEVQYILAVDVYWVTANSVLYVVYEPPSPHWISGIAMQQF